MRRADCKHGFTLVEILVSVTLFIVLSGIMVANYNGFNDAQIVKQAVNSMRSNLQAARTKAASGVKPTGCDELVGYEVDFPTDAKYVISALCVVSGSQQLAGTATTYTLPVGVSFAQIPLPTVFYVLDRGASVGQTITLTGKNKTASLSILASGAVN